MARLSPEMSQNQKIKVVAETKQKLSERGISISLEEGFRIFEKTDEMMELVLQNIKGSKEKI